MNCDRVRDVLAEHLLGTLEGPEDLEVRRHLRGCAGCRHEMAALAEGVSTFARAAHEIDPPEALRERVLTVLEEEWSSEAPAPGRTRRPVSWLAWAAAVVAVTGSLGWGLVSNHRAASFEARALKWDAFLGVLGGENVRVGRLHPDGTQDLDGSVVLYDSRVGQSWALVLARAPGMEGEADVVLSSSAGGRTILLHPMYFGRGGEASTWLVTSWSLRPFDRVTLTDAETGAVLATGTVPGD